MLAVLLRGRDGALIGVAHLRVLVVARDAHVGGQIVGAEQRHVDAIDRENLLRAIDRLGGLELHDHHRGVVDRRVELARRHGAVLQLRQHAGKAALALRRIFRGAHDLARLRGGAHVRRDDAERAAVEHALDQLDLRARAPAARSRRSAPRSRSGSWFRARARNAPDRCRASRSPRSRQPARSRPSARAAPSSTTRPRRARGAP